MKIIHQNGYSKEELLTWKLTIFKNIIESIQSIVSAMKKFDYEFETLKDPVCHTMLDSFIFYAPN
jgi:guanine nucleotide-binding protein G(i) subunit alpha